MRSVNTEKTYEVVTPIVLDLALNAIEDVKSYETSEEVIIDRFGVRKGDMFKVGKKIETRRIVKTLVSGLDNTWSEAFKVENTKFEFESILKWTGKKFITKG